MLVIAGVFGQNMLAINNTLFFGGITGADLELWKSDGTSAGTVLVKDIYPGSSSGSPIYLTNMNDTLYFSAVTSASGMELWKSDGTTAGTVLVKDINPGAANSNPANLIGVNGTLYFSAVDAANGRELWKSDGTGAGTVLVKDIYTGTQGAISSVPPSSYYFTNINDTLFFSATDGVNGQELWKSDGTTSGTVMVGDINPGAGDSKPLWFAKIKNTIYFSAQSTVNNTELWKYGGTSGGTTSVRSIVNNSSISAFPNPTNGRFSIRLGNNLTMMNVEVYNVIGEMVLQQSFNEIDLSGKPKGIYFVKVYTENKTFLEKIVLQ